MVPERQLHSGASFPNVPGPHLSRWLKLGHVTGCVFPAHNKQDGRRVAFPVEECSARTMVLNHPCTFPVFPLFREKTGIYHRQWETPQRVPGARTRGGGRECIGRGCRERTLGHSAGEGSSATTVMSLGMGQNLPPPRWGTASMAPQHRAPPDPHRAPKGVLGTTLSML